MSSFYTRLLGNDSSTYWPPLGANSWGDSVFASPASMTCQWEDRQEMFFDQMGEQRQGRAVVMLPSPATVNGWLYHGASSEADPRNVSGADLIRAVETIKSIRGDITTYKAIL